MTAPTIYLDHAATTPVSPAAQEAVARGLADWANPSSVHARGRAARAALEDARARVAAALGWAGEVIFTSGATEALEIGWTRARVTGRAASAVEHVAVLRLAGDATIAVDSVGRVEPEAVPSGGLVAVMHANNETGVLQPLDAVAARVRGGGGLLLADCAQTAGKVALPDADLVAIAGHKLGGPPGIGALLVREFAMLTAIGGQEQGYRPGTESLPLALGLAAALEDDHGWMAGATDLRRRFEADLVALGGVVVAADAERLPTVSSYRLPGLRAAAVLIRADAAGIAISAGSACASGSIRPSHVLTAMGLPAAEAREVFRVSIGPETRAADLDALIATLATARPAMGAA